MNSLKQEETNAANRENMYVQDDVKVRLVRGGLL
mgnify:CR=1 FL=1